MKTRQGICAMAAINAVQAQSSVPKAAGSTVPVTVENFIRAESDLYLGAVALKEGGFGKFEQHRELSPIDAQTGTRFIPLRFSILTPDR